MSSLWLSIPVTIIVLVLVLLGLRQAYAQAPSNDHKDQPAESMFSKPPTFGLKTPTLGGKQFWADELCFHGWRIQRNVLDGGYRLLDENNKRHVQGNLEKCRDRLDQIKREKNLPPMRGKVVIVLHGLIRSRSSMSKLCNYLRKYGDYLVLNVTYPSTRQSITKHAESLKRVVDNLDGIEEINLVGHSLGNIVVRKYLAGDGENGRKLPDPRINRIVMLAPPNHGSRIARALKGNTLFRTINGPAGQELGPGWDGMAGKLAMPDVEFGIIAGGRGGRFGHGRKSPVDDNPPKDGKQPPSKRGYNPWLPDDNDGTVSVASTRLAGARDFAVLPVIHSLIMNDKTVHEYTLRFLQKGHFISAEERCPIESVEAEPAR